MRSSPPLRVGDMADCGANPCTRTSRPPTGAVVLAIRTSSLTETEPARGDSQVFDSIETSTDTLPLIEDIAMTSLVLALALGSTSFGHQGAYASGQAPQKVLPAAQAPTKCPPVPSKCPPVPSKCPPVPSKCPPAPSKVFPNAQAPAKSSPQY